MADLQQNSANKSQTNVIQCVINFNSSKLEQLES